jgi:hypothetical protein
MGRENGHKRLKPPDVGLARVQDVAEPLGKGPQPFLQKQVRVWMLR